MACKQTEERHERKWSGISSDLKLGVVDGNNSSHVSCDSENTKHSTLIQKRGTENCSKVWNWCGSILFSGKLSDLFWWPQSNLCSIYISRDELVRLFFEETQNLNALCPFFQLRVVCNVYKSLIIFFQNG